MPAPKISLYNIKNAHELSLPNLHETDYYRSLLENPTTTYIENISAKLNLLKVNNQIFPLLIGSGNYRDSYVCSPYDHYISLGLESLHFVKHRWVRGIAQLGLKALGRFVKSTNINSTVYINHSMLATDLQPNHLPSAFLEHMICFLKTKFPAHALIFRSVNKHTCPLLSSKLKALGFKFIASRLVHITEVNHPGLLKTRIIKSDLKLWNEKKHEVICQEHFSEEDERHIIKLCHSLSLDHHSNFNPKVSLDFLKLLKKDPSFRMQALKLNGQIEGVAGYHIKDNVLVCSLFGYDKLHPNKTGIYRLLSTLVLLEAANHAEIFHQSAGASFYKSIRRAQPSQEYQAVFTKHLAISQKTGWNMLKALINVFAIPFMKRY